MVAGRLTVCRQKQTKQVLKLAENNFLGKACWSGQRINALPQMHEQATWLLGRQRARCFLPSIS